MHNVIRLTFAGPFRTQPVTGTDNESGRPGREPRLDVGALVAHDEGTGEELNHAPINRIKRFKRAASARDHRLIADDHDRTAEWIQQTNTAGCSGQQLHTFNRREVMIHAGRANA